MTQAVRVAAPESPVQPPVAAPRRRTEGWLRRLPLLPALVFTIAVTQVPFLLTVWYSLQSWNLLHPGTKHYVGLHNYRLIFSDPIFRTAVKNTVLFTVAPVLLSIVIGTGIALLLDRRVFGRGFLRTLIVSPFLVMPAAAALVWKFTILDPVFGILNYVLKPFGVGKVDWINTHSQATIITVLTWQWTPFMVLIVLAGLQSQSQDILEAARVDGANGWRIFRSFTVPHLRPYLELGILLGSIYIVQAFDAIFMITSGGPGQKTTNLPYYLYEVAFRGFDIGRASAMGVVVVVATIIIATLALRLVSSLFSDEGMGSR
ncbi:MAG TPA: sugar ABC transporter permease [Mycobacterium sp.]|jgi:sorbitol/mannitol transport system permease protein|nr:sugar ABC transporter permease [Mycobacterium sp.]